MGAVSVLGCVFLLASGAATGAGRARVELLEDSVAEVVSLRTGAVSHVARKLLPEGAREGDVLVDGRIDLQATRRMAAKTSALQAEVLSPMPSGGLDLDDDDDASTTTAHR